MNHEFWNLLKARSEAIGTGDPVIQKVQLWPSESHHEGKETVLKSHGGGELWQELQAKNVLRWNQIAMVAITKWAQCLLCKLWKERQWHTTRAPAALDDCDFNLEVNVSTSFKLKQSIRPWWCDLLSHKSLFRDIFNLCSPRFTPPLKDNYHTSTQEEHSDLPQWLPTISPYIHCNVLQDIGYDASNSCLRYDLQPIQFTYCHIRTAADAISLALHIALDHLDNRNTYLRLLFIDYN